MDFDTLIGGDYKLVVEPLAYLCYNGQQFAMTATEAALYDQVVNGDLRKKLGSSPIKSAAGDFSGGSGSRLHCMVRQPHG